MLTNHQVIIAHALPPFVGSFENLRASADSILKPGKDSGLELHLRA